MSHRDAIHAEEYKGLNIYIVPDDDPQSSDPMDWDMLGKQVYWHRRYTLGHCYKETNKFTPEEWLRYAINIEWKEVAKKFREWRKTDDAIFKQDLDITEWFEDETTLSDLLELFSTNNVVIPVSCYEHGGITISASGRRAGWDMFDSGQLGFVYVSHEDVKKEYKVKRLTKKVLEQAEKTLRGEVETYDDYLTGQVYGYIIEDENNEQLDSCWGFLGDYKYCLEEAQSAADYWVEKKEKELKLNDERIKG